MKKITSGFLAITLAVAMLFACASVSHAKDAKDMVFGVIMMTQDIPVQVAMNTGMKERAQELGGITIKIFNAQWDSAKQMNAIENFITQKVDAILLAPIDADAIVNGVKTANKAGIPVITFDSNAHGGDLVSFVESNNGHAGQLVAEYMAWRLKGKGNVALFDYPAAQASRDRTAAWHKVLEKYPGIKVVQNESAVTVPDGIKSAENVLQAHPNLDAFFCINDPGGLGAFQAIKARGLLDKVFVAAIDGDPKAVELIGQGAGYELTVAQFGAEVGRLTVQTAYNHLNGKKVDKHIKVPVMPVTKDNYKMYPGWEGKVPADLTPPWTKKQ